MKDRFEIRIFNERFNVEYDYCTGNEDVCLSVKVDTSEELYAKWEELIKEYEGDSYAVWDHKNKQTIVWGAYDPNDWQILDEYFEED